MTRLSRSVDSFIAKKVTRRTAAGRQIMLKARGIRRIRADPQARLTVYSEVAVGQDGPDWIHDYLMTPLARQGPSGQAKVGLTPKILYHTGVDADVLCNQAMVGDYWVPFSLENLADYWVTPSSSEGVRGTEDTGFKRLGYRSTSLIMRRRGRRTFDIVGQGYAFGGLDLVRRKSLKVELETNLDLGDWLVLAAQDHCLKPIGFDSEARLRRSTTVVSDSHSTAPPMARIRKIKYVVRPVHGSERELVEGIDSWFLEDK